MPDSDVMDLPDPDDDNGLTPVEDAAVQQMQTDAEQPVEATPIHTANPALTEINEWLAASASRNLFKSGELVDFMASDLFDDYEGIQSVVLEYRDHARGPSFNEFVSSIVVMDLCLDMRNALMSALADD